MLRPLRSYKPLTIILTAGNKKEIITASLDKTLALWNLEVSSRHLHAADWAFMSLHLTKRPLESLEGCWKHERRQEHKA